MKGNFYRIAIIAILFVLALSLVTPKALWLFTIIGPLVLLGLYDLFQRKHTVLRNFPVIGHFRYMLEFIRPEIQQYFIEPDWSGRPINRIKRVLVYARAKGELETIPFGSHLDMYSIGHEWLEHSLHPIPPVTEDPRVLIGNKQCKKPYNASILNISGMSYGAISKNAVLALNRGAKEGNFYHNTGEGGLTPYHLEYGADLVLQLGTAYFGCRTKDGQFCPETFKKLNDENHSIKMIEIKISQGAKPGGGGILPAKKVTEEIAMLRGIPVGVEVISPPTHSAFKNPYEMMEFVTTLRELSKGKPIGIKLCVGRKKDFDDICKAMIETKTFVDFMTIDGSEGGTGAAPIAFIDSVGTPLVESLVYAHDTLLEYGIRNKIKIISSGKVFSEFDIISKIALGADLVNTARAMMLALGCIQALRCNTNRCPTGVTTHNPNLTYGLIPEEKYKRVERYHNETVKRVMEVIGAAGMESLNELERKHIMRRVSHTAVMSFEEIYPYT